MAQDPGEVKQAVSRTLRDSLERLQRTTEELNHAVSDLVSACASTRPVNSLPPILRAQTAAASLAVSLEVLARFVTAALQPPHGIPEPMMASEPGTPAISESMMESQPKETKLELPASDMMEEGGPVGSDQADPEVAIEISASEEISPVSADVAPPAAPFDMAALSAEQLQLHRRADRVAKVAMQDIQLIQPEEVKLGRERKDLCVRLGEDIEKARKEYDRRFHAILGHPVDCFYDRMVEILGDGDPETLGEYLYPSPVLHR